jgi:hypothetical protein
MKIFNIILLFLLLSSCSHQTKTGTISISTSSIGLVKNQYLSNPIYINSNLDDQKVPQDALRIHPGHFLSIKNTKIENEKILSMLEQLNFHLVNLSLEDIAVAETQEIKFEKYKKLIFINSTVLDTSMDDLYKKTNVLPYYAMEEVVFIGLSDNQYIKPLNTNRFLINDNVYSVLKIKKQTREKKYKSYILIHHLGNEITDIMNRLPPTFIDSLAK